MVERLRRLRDRLGAADREQLLTEERHRIARELHDRVEQAFFSIGLTVTFAFRNLQTAPVEMLKTHLGEIRASAAQGAEDLRAAIFALSRAEIRDRGVAQTLWQMVRQFQQKTGVEADLVLSGTEHRVSPETAEVLYAVAREGLANVEQHAHASVAILNLRFDLNAVTLTVQDDGVGASPLLLGALHDSTTRFGLRAINERVSLLGGAFTAEQGDEGGFVVQARVPLRGEAP
jgi:signal transduction histidine kinase